MISQYKEKEKTDLRRLRLAAQSILNTDSQNILVELIKHYPLKKEYEPGNIGYCLYQAFSKTIPHLTVEGFESIVQQYQESHNVGIYIPILNEFARNLESALTQG